MHHASRGIKVYHLSIQHIVPEIINQQKKIIDVKESKTMDIKYGIEVIDTDGTVLGTVDRVIRNSWSGEVSKFVVRGCSPAGDLILSPQDVIEVTESNLKLNVPSDKLETNRRL